MSKKSDMEPTEDRIESNIGTICLEDKLRSAEQHIQKLTLQLKEKECEIHEHVRRWKFYEQIVKNLTTFK